MSAPSIAPSSALARGAFTTTPTPSDPYCYQVGFGNRFATEAIPGTLPLGQNTPQRCKYDLVSEQLNGTPFVAPRASQLHAWFYRIKPSVVHKPLKRWPKNPDLEAVFSALNPNTIFTPQDMGWDKFPLPEPSQPVDFIGGLKTIAGHGEPSLKEGLAVHVYMANTSMQNKAFCNNDGEMLILPQEGRLDIQTEFGRLMVQPGELVVIPAGVRIKVSLPDGIGRGYIQEIYGSHYVLPELGPIGSNGMAMPRDFEIPVASFDIDHSNTWEIVVKLAGELFGYEQNHTPFDVVAWHGNYTPYKYALEKFINSATVDREQSDPSIYCVLTAPSKVSSIALTELLVFTPKWNVTTNTFRPPYYHRNVATELMGMIYGTWTGSATHLEPGGLTYEPSFMPHGESYKRWKEATSADLPPLRVNERAIAFMMHISGHISLTKYALERTGKLQEQREDLWDDWSGGFLDHLSEVNQDLIKAGLPPLDKLNKF
ncbi:homogentisate 1,2-dioxygenase [Talaromyces proteolyticus]|uniref:homogentisate 1,2-dioxygenase n=1 Tax=Talaromyces proteolyticus TaxID=1131652 RepID=A0AAD4L081_9EURO|nr:homogentisate 1,2-dioxygenase [Talaromyces proteolyticus]KAH8703844.1 homogentisate 1,2-dioxygenase [Talaromyces proteolyticus]